MCIQLSCIFAIFLFLSGSCRASHLLARNATENGSTSAIKMLLGLKDIKRFMKKLSLQEKESLFDKIYKEVYKEECPKKDLEWITSDGKLFFETVRRLLLTHTKKHSPYSLQLYSLLAAHKKGLLTQGVVKKLHPELRNYCQQVRVVSQSPDKVLMQAIKWDDFDLLKLAIEHGASVDEFDELWRSPLHYAALRGNEKIVLEILSCRHVSGSLYDSFCCTASDCAAINDHYKLAELLKSYCYHDKKAPSPLHVAAAWNCFDKVKKLCTKESVNSLNRRGQTPLQCAVMAGNLEVARYLEKMGAHASICDEEQDFPLHKAAAAANTEMVKFLLSGKNRKELLEAKNSKGETALHCSACKSKECTNLLIKSGATVDALDVNGETPLMRAAYFDKPKIFNLLLIAGADKDLCSANDRTVLHAAAFGCAKKCIKILLDLGVKADVVDALGSSPLREVVMCSDDPECVTLLLDAGGSVDAQRNDGTTALMMAARYGNVKSLQVLLEAQADPSKQDTEGRTALHYAALGGHLKSVKLLCQEDFSIDTCDNKGQTPLMCAVSATNGVSCVNYLLSKGADKNQARHDRHTPATLAIKLKKTDCFEELVKAGADFTLKNAKGRVALHYAAKKGNKECVRLLLGAGVDVDPLDRKEVTPLLLACRFGSPKCVQLLLKAGADKNSVMDEGVTPLAIAVYSGSFTCLDLLLKAKADVFYKGPMNTTLLHFVVAERSGKYVRLFIEAGLDPNAKDEHGATPLHYAAEKKSIESIKELLAGGADICVANNDGKTAYQIACEYEYADNEVREFLKDALIKKQVEKIVD